MRKFVCLVTVAGLAGCGGSSVAYLGAVTARPDATGVISGVPADDYTVVRDEAGNGYVLGFTIGADPDDFSDGNIAGSTANYAYSGLLPDADVGELPTVGNASFIGRYDVVLVEGYDQTSNPNAWAVSESSGPFRLRVNFASGAVSGESFDEQLTVHRSADADPFIGDPAFVSGFDGSVEFRGIQGDFYTAALGQDGAVAAFNGQDDSGFFAGGFVVSGSD